MTLLRLENLVVRRNETKVIDGIRAEIRPGELVALIGPNGAGKSTLMRAALGLRPAQGTIELGGQALRALSPRDRALRAAYIPQDHVIAWPISVEALVALGRAPCRHGRRADAAAVDEALRATDLQALRQRPASSLSGGERARALIARALAQDTPLLLADEPTAGLDPAHALGLMLRFRALARQGRGILVSLHDLGLAARYCDRLILLQAGRVVAEGTPETVLTPARLASAYGITAYAARDENGLILQPTGLATP